MDVLSDVMAVVRTGQPRSARHQWRSPWAQRFDPVPGSIGFQVILQGPCRLTREGAAPVDLAAGDIVLRPRGRGHTLASGPGEDSTTASVCGAYQLDAGHALALLDDLPELIHLPGHLDRQPQLRATAELLATELDRPRPGTAAIVPALLDILLLHMLRTWLDQQSAGGVANGWAAALRDPPIAGALRAMHRDLARSWTVAALAAEAGLSRTEFARRFALLLGRPPLAYLTWWRMTTAGRLLLQSDAPLRVIAAEVGYRSEFAFASAFKRHFGIAPGAHRRGGNPVARSGSDR
ncbi:AraC family transcriptional regulator [Solwaraspora sp. WMMA2101]|uniref:AraC family transcriptional regulator n=1 Tax=Solwaraspora sp. WMMA2101 TaxID=3404124 RepID=UPI003B9631FB